MKTIANYSVFERITTNMVKTFGKVEKGNEGDFALELASIEGNLLKMRRANKANNGRRALEAIKICLFIIDGYINGWEYDLSKYRTPDNESLVEAILMAFDPFTNGEIQEALNNTYDWHSLEDLRDYFTSPIQCLLRVEESVQLWTKRDGADGYFNFIEEFMGNMVPYDEQMNFTAKLRKPF